MLKLKEGEYDVAFIYNLLEEEASKAVGYIISVINQMNNQIYDSEFFSDVIVLDDYEYEPNPKGQLRKSLWGRKGLYVFVLKNDVYLTYKEVSDYCSGTNGAGFYKWEEQHLVKGQHFYQGSTINSLLSRIREHYSENCNAAALKLNNSSRIIMKDKLRLFVFPLRRDFDKCSYFIRMIEDQLHNRVPAATGNKRT